MCRVCGAKESSFAVVPLFSIPVGMWKWTGQRRACWLSNANTGSVRASGISTRQFNRIRIV